MTRLVVAGIVGLLSLATASAEDGLSGATVDLNDPQSIASLQSDNPAHYEKIQKIMDRVSRQQDGNIRRSIETEFNAREVSFSPFLFLTSYPPKSSLSFVLDGVQYQALVIIREKEFRGSAQLMWLETVDR